MNPRSAKQKGRLLEKWVAEQLRHSGLDKQARPEIGSGSGRFKGDISTKLPLTFECKNTKKLRFNEAFKQAEKASLGYQEPVVVYHPPQTALESSKVIMSWQLFLMLAKAFFKES